MHELAALSEAQRQQALEWLRLLQPHLEVGRSLVQAACEAGIPHRTAQRWDEAVAAILHCTGGNLRLLLLLLTQMERILQINGLSRVTRPVLEAARESLVIGQT
jgi:hypothetical protein